MFDEGCNEQLRVPGVIVRHESPLPTCPLPFPIRKPGDYSIVDEYRIHDMMAYDPQFNPRRRRAPTPRPDFVVVDGPEIAAILDAKYRDLWVNPLPRDMLYQLAMYALSQGIGAKATILYPVVDSSASDARINISDAAFGVPRAQVILRPVNLVELERLLSARKSIQVERCLNAMATRLVFGNTSSELVESIVTDMAYTY